jgi:class 3 adenylate cyclase
MHAVGKPVAAVPVRRGIPDHLAEKIRSGAGSLEGERKQVTVLFADVKGSMELERALGDERWRQVMDRFFSILCEGIHRFEGTVDKFTGDGVMAIFGAPIAHEDHARRACYAALDLQRELASYATELRQSAGLSFSVRIGLNSGEVVVGTIGDDLGMAYTAIGHTVGLAQRMEQLAAPDCVYLSEYTAQVVHGYFEFADLGEFEVKGAGRPVRVFELTDIGTARGRIDVRRAPFVGRVGELDALRSEFRRACAEQRPGLVTIVGDVGVGKSRLAREFVAGLAVESRPPRCLTGRCPSYGRGVTYRALGDVLAELLGLHESDPRDVIVDRLGAHRILGLTLGLDVAGAVHPLAAIHLMREAWRELLSQLVAERPTVVLVEDLHWAQDDLLDLLEYLLDGVAGCLLLVGAARPELLTARPSWGRRGDATTVWLEPLPLAEARKLVDEAPAELRELVLERAEGNPFFIEELLARISDGVEVAAIPDSVQAVLAARIDQLAPLEKEALQAAAVVGRAFWREPVRELLGGASPSFELLEERDFVRPGSRSSFEGLRELTFKHALTREVAYAGLPRSKRARLHAGVARWLEEFGGGRDEHATVLAHHYAEAARQEDTDLAWADDNVERERVGAKAVAWLRRAAELAVSRYEIDDGIELLRQAIELECDTDARCTLWRSLAHANALKFDGEAFWTAMEAALEVAGDDRTRAEISSRLAIESYVRAGMWTKTPALERVDGWITRALELSQPGTASRAQALIATACRDLDDADAAAEAAAIAERLDDPELCVHAWDACAVVAMAVADYEAAWRWRTRRLQLLDRITDPDLRTIIGETPYSACVATCRFDQAREIAHHHDELTRSLTPHHRLHGAAILLEVEELLGSWSAIRSLEHHVRDTVAANTDNPCLRNARSLLVCALAAACLGDLATAAELERAADALGSPNKPLLDAPRLRLALARGDLERADELLARLQADHGWYSRGHGTSLATLITRLDGHAALGHRHQLERDAPRLLIPGTFVEPFALRALGFVRDDRELLERSLARFGELALDWYAAETEALLTA